MASLDLRGVTLRSGAAVVVRDVDLVAETGTVVGVVGPSGSGKTSLLRAVAGLDPPAAGSVWFDGVDVTALPPAERNIAMVFQQPALYPNRTVRGNIAFPLEVRHAAIDEIRRRVGAEARALHIESLLGRRPKQLSAGEAHVVQVARAMVRNPAVLLLDEPFANLDAELAAHLRREVLLIQRGFGVTTMIATNERLDAMTMADRLAVIEDGRITQFAPPLEVYDHPISIAAAMVTGEADILEVRVETDREGAWIVHPGFRVRAWQPALRRHAQRRLQLVVRPEWWQFDEHGPVDVVVERAQTWGTLTALWCRADGHPMTVKLGEVPPQTFAPGDRLTLRLDRYVLVDPTDGRRLDLG